MPKMNALVSLLLITQDKHDIPNHLLLQMFVQAVGPHQNATSAFLSEQQEIP